MNDFFHSVISLLESPSSMNMINREQWHYIDCDIAQSSILYYFLSGSADARKFRLPLYPSSRRLLLRHNSCFSVKDSPPVDGAIGIMEHTHRWLVAIALLVN